MVAFVAAIRRLPGGCFAKMPKSQGMYAVPASTSMNNLATYFKTWPKHKSQFLLYGGAPRYMATITSSPQSVPKKEAEGPEHVYGPAATVAGPGHGQGSAADAAESAKPLGLAGIARRFKKGQKLSMVTAYDYPSSRFARGAGVELVLVGDSLGNCRLGLPDTVGVTMDDMIRATQSVRRGIDAAPIGNPGPKPVVVGDMPFGSYLLEADALKNAAAFRMAGADMVKMEGGRYLAPLVRSLTNAGIAVMGHIGLEPQRALLQGGLRLQGTNVEDAMEIIEDAKALAAAGARAIVVECVPEEVACAVQASVGVPIIGIGAGKHVAGQVLVCDDMLGVHGKPPSFVKIFANVGQASTDAYASYVSEVRSGSFPGKLYSRKMKPEELKKLQDMLPEVAAATAATAEDPVPEQIASPDVLAMHIASPWTARSLPMPMISSAMELMPGRRLLRCSPGTRGLATAQGLQVLRSLDDVRAWRHAAAQAGRRVGLVPTMGNLHEGHLELVDEAQRRADDVLVTIFVNPSQFAAHEDLDKYPRTMERDLELLRLRGASAVFAPNADEMYPSGIPGATVVVPRFVEGLSEAAVRPTHFTGVATVCLKLFNLTQPDVAVFGQKDAMQCAVIMRMLEDFMMTDRLSLVIAPTSRDSDGLARSSRNSYLTEGMRKKAPAIFRALTDATAAPGATAGSVRALVREALVKADTEVSYVSVADTKEMTEKEDGASLSNSVVSVACVLQEGACTVRLIDNVLVPSSE